MAILKKPEPKKCKCATPSRSASGVSELLQTLNVNQAEMHNVQLSIMKADLRLHIAQADLAETVAARAKADFAEVLAARRSACKQTSRVVSERICRATEDTIPAR